VQQAVNAPKISFVSNTQHSVTDHRQTKVLSPEGSPHRNKEVYVYIYYISISFYILFAYKNVYLPKAGVI